MNNSENTILRAEQSRAEQSRAEIRIIGRMDNTLDNTLESANRVYGISGLAPTIPTCSGGGHQPKIIDVSIVAQRGGRRVNDEQHLEERKDGLCNCLTTVQKDNMVLIKQATAEGYIECELPGIADLNYINSTTRRGRVQEGGQISPTIATENTPSVLEKFTWEIDGVKYLVRIRKLTPRECFRLQSFSDEDFDKAAAVVSNTQLYRAAGDSIAEEVLKAIFRKLLD